MSPAKKYKPTPRFEVRKTAQNTYCVVRIDKKLQHQLPQTEHPSMKVAQEWLKLYRAMAQHYL